MQPINVLVHPSNEAPGFWRWAVHLGADWLDQSSCLNAGVGGDRDEAALRGQAVAVAVAKFAQAHRLLVGGDTYYLEADPITEPWPLLEVLEV